MGGLHSWQQLLGWNEVSDIERKQKKKGAPCMSIVPFQLLPFCAVSCCCYPPFVFGGTAGGG